jgi:hypothetical protein
MKILIAGDSFCHGGSHVGSDYAWTRQIEYMLPNAKVTCVGKAATSVFSALQQVKEQLAIDHSYDAVIVLITNHERLHQTSDPLISNLPHALAYKELYKKSNLNDKDTFNKIEAARMYYEFLYDHDLGVFILDSCLKELQSLCAGRRLILFPAFDAFSDSPFASTLLSGYGFNLLQVVNWENQNFTQLGPELSTRGWKEHIALGANRVGKVNHMCVDNQHVLARYFADLIQYNKSDIRLDSFAKLPKEDFKLYYRPLSEVQYKGGNF